MGYGTEIAIGAIVGALVGGGSAAARGAEDEEIMWNALGGAALGAATSGAGTAFQAAGQGGGAGAQAASQSGQAASQSGQAAAQGAASSTTSGAAGGAGGAVGGAAAGAGGATAGATAQESGKQAVLSLLAETAADQPIQIAGQGATSSALPAANTAGMEMWPSIPQYMKYGGEQGGLFNQANYLLKGAYEYPGVQAGIKGGRYASKIGSVAKSMTPPEIATRMPNIGQQLQGKQYGMDWYKKQQQANTPKPRIGSSLGYGFDPEDPYGRKNRAGMWDSYY